MSSKENRIKIPIIPYGLRQEETIVQIAVALENINSVVTDVFQQIECNIQRHRQYLSSLQKRSAIIASKVEKLAGKNVTTTVFSHHKFPVEEEPLGTLFKMNLKPIESNINVPIESKFQHAKYNKIPNKLQFFHLKPKNDDSIDLLDSTKHGLGNLPPEISNVDSLFLFNSFQNVYEKYVMLDPLSITASQHVIEETEKTDIAAAPSSIVNSEIFQNEDYFTGFYMPAFKEVPSIDVPMDLPDLPGIAGDLKFNSLVEKPVAPSKQVQEVDKSSKSINEITIDDLPVISKPVKPVISSQEFSASNATKNSEFRSDSNLLLSDAAAPPPPPPPLPASVAPPPPPLPVNDENNDKISFSSDAELAPKAVVSSDNAHATLMEAIRKAGGKEKAQLRQVVQIEQEASKEPSDGIFMQDLYAALARRRKGISGQHKQDKNVSMMDRVSAMIAPASEESENNSAEDDGNDWED